MAKTITSGLQKELDVSFRIHISCESKLNAFLVSGDKFGCFQSDCLPATGREQGKGLQLGEVYISVSHCAVRQRW